MEPKEIINSIASLKNEVYNYITNTEHWLFYWIANKEVQDFIKEYPEDFEDRISLSINTLDTSPSVTIHFDEHPNEVQYIKRYAGIPVFRESAKANWIWWGGNFREMQIKEKEKEVSYYKKKAAEIEEEITRLKNQN